MEQTNDALLAEAFAAGRRAGLAGLPMSLASGEETSLEKQQWILGWKSGSAQYAYHEALRSVA